MESDKSISFQKFCDSLSLLVDGQAQNTVMYAPIKQKMSGLKKIYMNLKNSINCQFSPISVSSWPHQII